MRLSELEDLINQIKANVHPENKNPNVSFWLKDQVEEEVRKFPRKMVFIDTVPTFDGCHPKQHITHPTKDFSIPLKLYEQD